MLRFRGIRPRIVLPSGVIKTPHTLPIFRIKGEVKCFAVVPEAGC
jgi:hypothetical protein